MMLAKEIVALVVCLGLVAGCANRVAEDEPTHDDHEEESEQLVLSVEAYETAGIQIAPVGLRTLVPTIKVTGTLSYDERSMAIATARIGGRITDVVADYGQRVSAGEGLAWIDSPELGAAQADYLRAESTARLRRAEYERAQLLLEREAISRGALLRREADWQTAQAELHTAEQKLHILGLAQADIVALSDDREGRDVVFVQSAERAFEVREVGLGDASGDWVEIRSGLSEGEPIAVSGVFTLKSEVLKGGLEEHDH